MFVPTLVRNQIANPEPRTMGCRSAPIHPTVLRSKHTLPYQRTPQKDCNESHQQPSTWQLVTLRTKLQYLDIPFRQLEPILVYPHEATNYQRSSSEHWSWSLHWGPIISLCVLSVGRP